MPQKEGATRKQIPFASGQQKRKRYDLLTLSDSPVRLITRLDHLAAIPLGTPSSGLTWLEPC